MNMAVVESFISGDELKQDDGGIYIYAVWCLLKDISHQDSTQLIKK